MNIKRLAIVLKHANSSPPSHAREEFYSLKQAICEHYGKRVGYDVQEIVDRCWGYRYEPCDEHCGKCGGTGIYNKKIVLLERWEIAGQIFHRPLQRMPVAFSEVAPTINGRIKHRFSKLAFACYRVLSLVLYPQFHLYLDQFRTDEKNLRRFKAVLAYLLEFPRDKWRATQIKFDEMQQVQLDAKIKERRDALIPF